MAAAGLADLVANCAEGRLPKSFTMLFSFSYLSSNTSKMYSNVREIILMHSELHL